MRVLLKHIILFVTLVILCFSGLIPSIKGGVDWIIFILFSFIISFYALKTKYNKLSFNKYLLVYSFILIITIPLIGKKETESLEKRAFTELPSWNWHNVWQFFYQYQAYFGDRFAFRNKILDLHGKLNYDVFGFSVSTNKVNEGKDGWLFYADEQLISPIAIPFSKEELAQFKYNLEVTTTWFNQHGIKYYLTIPPLKHTIYHEKLSEYMKMRLNFSRIAQIKNYLDEHSSVNFIDYRNELAEGKKERELYFKNDSHWNQYGSFIGYTKIINTISKDFPQVVPFILNNYTEKWDSSSISTDLLKLIGRNNQLANVTLISNDTIKPILKYVAEGEEEWIIPKGINGLKLFVIRDSYTENLKLFLSANFDQSFYTWTTKIPMKKIAEKKPDIILHEISERLISDFLSLPPEIKNDTTFLKNYTIGNF